MCAYVCIEENYAPDAAGTIISYKSNHVQWLKNVSRQKLSEKKVSIILYNFVIKKIERSVLSISNFFKVGFS